MYSICVLIRMSSFSWNLNNFISFVIFFVLVKKRKKTDIVDKITWLILCDKITIIYGMLGICIYLW